MNPATQQAIAGIMSTEASRGSGIGRRKSTGAWQLAVGLMTGYHILVKLMPMIWSHAFPAGLKQAQDLPGWAGLVFVLAMVCYYRFPFVVGAALVVEILALLLGRKGLLGRSLVKMTALAVFLIDAGILLVVLRTALTVSNQSMRLI